jgi:hypothetical protein
LNDIDCGILLGPDEKFKTNYYSIIVVSYPPGGDTFELVEALELPDS